MAGDWIKMRVGLQQGDPHVVRIMSALQADKLRVIGGLHAVWCIFDQHSADGSLAYTPTEMDLFIGWSGFTQAMIDVDWMTFDGTKTLTMHNFEAHNGKSGKRRASEALRKQNARNVSASDADALRPREEERRVSTLSKKVEPRVKGFIRPTLEEVRAEINAKAYRIDAERFIAFYESKGWKVGNQPMKSWKAAIVTWVKRDGENRPPNSGALNNRGQRLLSEAKARLAK